MAAIGKVSAVFTASTSGLTAGVKAASSSFRSLGGDAKSLDSSLERLRSIGLNGAFASASAAARQLSAASEMLSANYKSGAISAEQFRDSMAALTRQADVQAQIFSAGVATTAQFATAQDVFASRSASLKDQLLAGAISFETYGRAMEAAQRSLDDSTGATAAADAEARAFADAMARGEAVSRSVATAEEKHAATLEELSDLLRAGAISQQTFDRAAAASANSMRAASSSAGKLDDGLSGVASRLNALIAINAAQLFGSIASAAANGVRSLLSFAQGQADIIDDASKLAARLGMTYGEFAGLSLAADLAGVSMESVGKASQRAEIAFANASSGSATATAAFARLGLSVEELNNMSAAERFDAIASSIAALPTEAERAAAAVRIFGKAGAELLPLFSGGAEGIAQAREQAERLGLALTSTQGREVEAMNDSFTMVSKAIAGIVQQVNAYMAPAVRGISEAFVKMVGDIGGKNIGQLIGQGIIDGAKYLATVADLIANGFRDMYFAAADVLGVTVTKEATRLKEMQAQIQAGTAPQTAVAGSGGFVTQLDPAFAAELASLTDAVAAQRQPLTMFTDAIASAEKAITDVMAAPPDVAPKPQLPPPGPPVVVNISEAIKGIDSRSSAGVAEMFRLMRGTTGDVQQQQLSVLEQIADNTAGEDFTVVEDF